VGLSTSSLKAIKEQAFVHALADCQSKQIGKNTRIWQYTVVLPEARIGEDCNICSHVFIENDVRIGDRVTIKAGVQLWDGLTVEDNVFIGPNVTFTNDKHPRSRQHPDTFLKTLKQGCSIGANATILPGITIGENAMIGAGAVVTRDVPAGQTWFGNPAQDMTPSETPKGFVAKKQTAHLEKNTSTQRVDKTVSGTTNRIPNNL
jgi:UDP-2-acetamido-3-amino-2,3-dideoxy-glucuronate N-acetyltransferase